MKRVTRLAALLTAASMLTLSLSACGKTIEIPEETEGGIKIGVVYTTAGLGDNNFNDMVNKGLEKAKTDLKITYDYSEPSSNGEVVTMLRDFAQAGEYDLVLALPFRFIR